MIRKTMIIFTIIMLPSSRTGMPAILREALLARSTIDISTSSSSSTGSENLASENLGHFEDVKDFENVDQMFRTSLSDLSLEEAAEVKIATMVIDEIFFPVS